MKGLCPHCREDVTVNGDISAGDLVHCPNCKQQIEVPPPNNPKFFPTLKASAVATMTFLIPATLYAVSFLVVSSISEQLDAWLKESLIELFAFGFIGGVVIPGVTALAILYRSCQRREDDESDLVFWLPRR